MIRINAENFKRHHEFGMNHDQERTLLRQRIG